MCHAGHNQPWFPTPEKKCGILQQKVLLVYHTHFEKIKIKICKL